MAIKLIANYSKRLGLPGYSSHQFEVSIETEISNPSDVQAVSADIYNTLQSAVDEQMQQVGFVPDEQYGRANNTPATSSSASSGSNRGNGYGNYSAQPDTPAASQEERWQCTEKQQSMILVKEELCGLLRLTKQKKVECREHIRKLKALMEQMEYDSNGHFKRLHKTMRQWYEPIIRMWRFSLNNGITEGFHRKMKLIQRRAYGFRNFQNYRLRVLVECSGAGDGDSKSGFHTLCA